MQPEPTPARFGYRTCFAVALLAILAVVPSGANAAVGPLYDVKATWGDSHLTPGDGDPTTAEGQFVIQARNIGDAEGAEETLAITDQLPEGVTATAIEWSQGEDYSSLCSGIGTGTVTCALPAFAVPLLVPAPGAMPDSLSLSPSGYLPTIYADVSVDSEAVGKGTNIATVSGGGAPAPAGDTDHVPFSAAPSPFGLAPGGFAADVFTAAYPFGEPARQASDRPFELRAGFDLAAETGVNDGSGGDSSRYIKSRGLPRTISLGLPPGLVANPRAVPLCDPADFAGNGVSDSSTMCPSDTQVGYVDISITEGSGDYGRGFKPNVNGLLNRVPLYNLEPPRGFPANFGFSVAGLVQGNIYATLDPTRGYSITALIPNVSGLAALRGVDVTLWGVPGDAAHDRFRYRLQGDAEGNVLGSAWGSAPIRPLFTNPMDCGEDNGGIRISLDSYAQPGQFTVPRENSDTLDVEGCEDPRFRFEPELSVRPAEVSTPGGPTGVDLRLDVPQRPDAVQNASELYAQNGAAEAIATPPIRRARISFPEGLTISPTVAQGLGDCTPAEIGLGSDAAAGCPQDSVIGTATIVTPLLEQPLDGRIYLAKPGENPPGSLFSLYLVFEDADRGVLVKIPVRLDLDPATGSITAIVDDLPQQPFSELSLHLKGGPRGVLRMPAECGTYATHYSLTPWTDGPPALGVSRIVVGDDCGGAGFGPELVAGTTSSVAGAWSRLTVDLSRQDREQNLAGLSLALPPGLSTDLADVGQCPLSLAARGACPMGSRIGSASISAGSGPVPLWIPQAGKPSADVFLTGPYNGAPFGLAIVAPVVVGPFDLGTVVVRGRIHVDPRSAQGTITLDPLPQILQGVPIEYRSVRVTVDRPNFVLNPTDCHEMSLSGVVTSASGTAAAVSSRYQARRCGRLGFKPRLGIRFSGALKQNGHPTVAVTLRPRRGDAAVRDATMLLSRGELLDQRHIVDVCTADRVSVGSCPANAAVGWASAWSPLLEQPLRGRVYLSSSLRKLPNLAIELGGRVRLLLIAHLTAARGRIRAGFDDLPDVPLDRLRLAMRGGRKGLLVNSEDLCAQPRRATVELHAHNDKIYSSRPRVMVDCGGTRTR